MASYNLPNHCEPTSLYLARISSAFGTCVPTSLAFLSTSLGVFSIISWLFAQVPQIYKNFELKSASGLSIYFLAEWLFGDLTNLLGALLTGQASWQVVVASYYVTVDVILCSQYFWYTHLKSKRRVRLLVHNIDSDDESDSSRDTLVGVSLSDEASGDEATNIQNGKDTKTAEEAPLKRQGGQDFRDLGSSSLAEKGTASFGQTRIRRTQSPPSVISPKALLLVSVLCVMLTEASPLHSNMAKPPPPASDSEYAGRILSWTSTLLYLGSRLPQIYKNAIRRSTSGLSPTLFIAAFCGNFFYSSSLLTNPLAWSSYPPYGLHGWVGPEGSDRRTWVALAAPFWLGAAGVLVMDATIGVQFLMYGEGLERSVVLVEDREGKSRWRNVSGWMRGWIPSPGPAVKENDTLEADTRPLLDGQSHRNTEYGGV